MNSKQLPARPNLEQYKKQAKDLVKGRKSGDPETIKRIEQHHSRMAGMSDSELQNARFSLADAQFIIAREHGFDSWPKFVKHIEELTRESSPSAIWRSAESALIAGDATALDRLISQNERMFRQERPPSPRRRGGLSPDYSGPDARSIIVSNHHFESWAGFAEYAGELKHKNSSVAQFEAAVDAIVTGNVAALDRLLRENPELVRARSPRAHHSTLLHYVGANGVEYFRQKTPKNIVAVTEVLLKAGAEIDAAADMYGGGSTALGLAATSIHPLLAGVQDNLIETLLAHGAAIDGLDDGSAVNDCLANGRPGAAELLAGRGARLDLEGAAGVGRLDLVRSFFNEDGSLKSDATKTQMRDGFAWACEYGRTGVVDFLLRQGMEVDAKLRHNGQTGLHWAALGGHSETVKLLLERKAPVSVKDESFGGTPLEWAFYGWVNPPSGTRRSRYYKVVALLTAAGATVDWEWFENDADRRTALKKARADRRMLAALNGETK